MLKCFGAFSGRFGNIGKEVYTKLEKAVHHLETISELIGPASGLIGTTSELIGTTSELIGTVSELVETASVHDFDGRGMGFRHGHYGTRRGWHGMCSRHRIREYNAYSNKIQRNNNHDNNKESGVWR